MTLSQSEVFQASLKRCLDSTSFIKDFYDRFMAHSPEIREKFRGTDFDQQYRMLADSLYVMAVAVRGGPENVARRDMQRITKRHQELDITAGMYDVWLERLLETAREHDPLFSDVLEEAWRATLGPGMEHMRSGKPFPEAKEGE